MSQQRATENSVYDIGKGGIDFLIHDMSPTLECLSRYDTCSFETRDDQQQFNSQPQGVLPTADQVRFVISELSTVLRQKGEAGDLFGVERGDGISSLLDNLNQTVFDTDVYPTYLDKAVNLLYFFVKNHPLADGNKRCGAFLTNMFFIVNQIQRLDNAVLTALTLLVAQSKPEEKEVTLGVLKFLLTH
jgi:prophage maintenance system killer protein